MAHSSKEQKGVKYILDAASVTFSRHAIPMMWKFRYVEVVQ